MQPSAPYRPPLLRRPNAAGNANATPGRCPFLGTPADPGTSLAFPSEANHCFRSSFPVPISSIHQESYCLSAQYAACPVYRQYEERENDAALVPLTSVVAAELAVAGAAAVVAPRPAAVPAPVDVAPAYPIAPTFEPDEPVYPDFPVDPGPDLATPARARRSSSSGVNGRAVLAGLLLLALLVLAGWAWLNFLNNRSGERQTAVGTVVTLPTLEATGEPDGAAIGIVAVGAAAEQTATALAETIPQTQATATSETTAGQSGAEDAAAGIAATATALFAGASATAECGAPDWWALYEVQPSDTLEGLAAMRGILPEELIVANCLPAPELSPGQELYLPPVGVIILLPGLATPIPTVASVSATTPPGLPTRPALVFPTPTFPGIVIIPTTQGPVEETVEPPRVSPPDDEPPVAPTSVRPTSAVPTPIRPTNTPPPPPTAQATRTPPGSGAPTRTPPGTAAPTLTPPLPLP